MFIVSNDTPDKTDVTKCLKSDTTESNVEECDDSIKTRKTEQEVKQLEGNPVNIVVMAISFH